MTGGRDPRFEPGSRPRHRAATRRALWNRGALAGDPWKLVEWGTEGEKAGFLARGMELFQLGIQGKDYPECWQTWAQLDDTVVALTWEP